jgi:outer membrane immunogenic protein
MRLLRESAMAVAMGAALLATPAAAGDRDGPFANLRPWTWQGAYAGVHVGFGDGDGALGGGQIGYNWQNGRVVYGVEADFALSSIEERACVLGSCISASLDWLATVRGRVGYLIDPSILVYGTAGFAIGHVSIDPDIFGLDGTETEFVIGLGVEGKINDRMTARLDFLTNDDLGGEVIRAGLNFKLGQ